MLAGDWLQPGYDCRRGRLPASRLAPVRSRRSIPRATLARAPRQMAFPEVRLSMRLAQQLPLATPNAPRRSAGVCQRLLCAQECLKPVGKLVEPPPVTGKADPHAQVGLSLRNSSGAFLSIGAMER